MSSLLETEKTWVEGNDPFLKVGTLFQTRKNKRSFYGVPGEVFIDMITNQPLPAGDILMFLEHLAGVVDAPPNNYYRLTTTGETKHYTCRSNKFWNVTQNKLVILKGYHWWFAQELDMISEL